jgi:hypothetical protein
LPPELTNAPICWSAATNCRTADRKGAVACQEGTAMATSGATTEYWCSGATAALPTAWSAVQERTRLSSV